MPQHLLELWEEQQRGQARQSELPLSVTNSENSTTIEHSSVYKYNTTVFGLSTIPFDWKVGGILVVKLGDFGVIIKPEEIGDMATLAPARPRPDLEAHRKAMSAPFPEVVSSLELIIGRKLTAYIASKKDARAIDRWLQTASPQKDVEPRLRLAYHVASMIAEFDSPAVVQAWLMGLNPELDDEVPIRLLREGDLNTDGKRVLNAARAFVAGG